MAKAKIKFNSKDINKILLSFAPELHQQAVDVAEKVKEKIPEDIEVSVRDGIGENGRPYSMVTIAHPSGIGRQAKDGVLTRSAAEQGLDIKRRVQE